MADEQGLDPVISAEAKNCKSEMGDSDFSKLLHSTPIVKDPFLPPYMNTEALKTEDLLPEINSTLKEINDNHGNNENLNTQATIDSQNEEDKTCDSSKEMDEMSDVESEGNERTSSSLSLQSGDESDLEDNLELSDHNELILLKWQRRKSCNFNLPTTTTVLERSDGGRVYLVGTVHFSKESQEDVAKTIRETQPDIVMVELCQSRIKILSMDENQILEESKNMNLEKMRAAIKQNGFLQGIMYLLLLSMSAHLTKELGMAPGGEFRRAFIETRKVPGCLMHLGDRPFNVTLQRALGALNWWQKLKFAWYIVTSKENITKEEVERFKRSDLLEKLLAEMTGEFPALSRVIVGERDAYLAYSLKLASTPVETPKGIIPAVVVGVVGIGHVPGIVKNWDKVTDEEIDEIMKIPVQSRSSKLIQSSVRAAVISVMVLGACRLLMPASVYSALSPRKAYEWVATSLIR